MNYKQKVRKMWCNRITKSHGSIVPSHLWKERLEQYCINFPNYLGLDLQIHTFPYKAEIVLLALWQNTMQLPNGLLLLATIFYLHLPLNLQRKINNGLQSCKVKYKKKKQSANRVDLLSILNAILESSWHSECTFYFYALHLQRFLSEKHK